MLKVLQKNKDKKWFEEIDQMYLKSISNFSQRRDFDEKLKLYAFFNNDLSYHTDILNKICNDALTQAAAEEELLAYNKIKNKYEVLHGELLRRGNNHKIILLTAKAIKAKNDKLLALISESVEKDLQLVFQKTKETLETMSQEDLVKFIQEQRQMLTPRDLNYKNFLSDMEIYKNKMLKHINITDDILTKKGQTFQHHFIGSEFYLKNTWKHGKPSIQVLNPLYCEFSKSANEYDVSKSDWFRYTDQITLGQALDEYVNYLSEDDIKDLLEQGQINGHWPDKTDLTDIKRATYHLDLARQIYKGYYNYVGTAESPDNQDWYSYKFRRVHLEFKAWDEMIFYTHTDEYNDQITVILDGNTNIIPSTASKIKYMNEYFEQDDKWVWADQYGNHEVIVKWIPQRYEMTKIGTGKLVQCRKVPFQPQYADAPISSFCLSYKGGIFNNLNSKPLSKMEAAIPPQLQILAIKQLQNKAIAKYRGSVLGRDVRQIPKQLADDQKDLLTAVEVIGKKTGTEYFDSQASSNGFQNPQQGAALTPMQIGDPQEFMMLQRAIEMLDMEVGLACGVSPSREGQSIQGTNVTDNQQSLVQTSLATEKDYYEHGQVWVKALDECLNAWDIYFRHYFENNPDVKETFLEHAMPDGTRELIKILPEYTQQSGIGVYLQDTYSDKDYKELMKMQMLQNTQDIDIETRSAIIKAISSGASTEEIHREVQILTGKIQERAQQQQEAEQQFQAMQMQAQRDLMAYQSQLRVQEANLIHDYQKDTKLAIAEIDATSYAMSADIDQDKRNDELQKEEMKIKADKEMQGKELEAKKEMQKRDLESKEKIAKMKPNPASK
jgi:hypothetical protein